ncbi:MAG: PoNe immunity protein domain-containing protein [Cyclobacteriaceae bacterium]
MRDQIKDKVYFEQTILRCSKSEETRREKLFNNKIAEDRILPVSRARASNLVRLLIAKYSIGHSINELISNYKEAVILVERSYKSFWKIKIGNPPQIFDQYILSTYDEILWLISFGILVNIEDKYLQLLAKLIDSDNIQDKLFEYLLSNQLNERNNHMHESDDGGSGIRDIFALLRVAINKEDKNACQKLVEKFLTNEWYIGHKDASWYDSHKGDTYIGYWCFEAAAVTCIKGLDDSSYRDHPYYPKDLADYYRANNS